LKPAFLALKQPGAPVFLIKNISPDDSFLVKTGHYSFRWAGIN